MRIRVNRSLKTKQKTAKEQGESQETTTIKPNGTKNELDTTELIIQIAFIIAIETAILRPFFTLHVTVLIILFKCLTNFPKERNNEEPGEPTFPKKPLRNWKKRKHGWEYSKCMTRLILVAMVAANLATTIAKHSNPNNPKHTFTKLLYSLAHDATATNQPGSDVPIRMATMTRDRTKIRKDLENLISSLNSITKQGKKLFDNIVNVRHKTVRNIAAMILKVWTHLLKARKTRRNRGTKLKRTGHPQTVGTVIYANKGDPSPYVPTVISN